MKTLSTAPRTLFELFPDSPTVAEKAYKFLEAHHDCAMGLRRTARRLGIDPKTVKAIYDHLIDTVEGIRFKSALLEQTEDFYSETTLTQLFETHAQQIEELEGEKNRAKDKQTKLNFIKEKRFWVKNMLDAALQCKPHVADAKVKALQETLKDDEKKLDDLLADFGQPDTDTDNIN
jgi:glycyl-tRNA synthetase (class II)